MVPWMNVWKRDYVEAWMI